MAERPSDVPAAMREAFADRRIAAAWNMFAVSEGPNQTAALGGFVRLLEKRGLTLSDIPTTVAAPKVVERVVVEKRAAPSFSDFASGMDSAFGDVAVRARRAATAGGDPRRRHVQGRDVPEAVTGTVRIADTEPNRTGLVTRFYVDSVDGDRMTTYGPITAISQSIRASLMRAADPQATRVVTIGIRRPNHIMKDPSARNVVFMH